MNDPLRISPTQIEVIERCERLWYYDRVLKLRDRTTSKSQGIGIRVEDMIADALFKGVEPPRSKEGNIARAMLKFLPEPGTPGMISQQGFEFPLETAAGFVIVNGKKDLVLPGTWVKDFKTTKSLSKWQKTPAVLLDDIQAEIYALDEWITHGLAPVPLDWVYGQTEGAQRADHTAILMPMEKIRKGQDRARAAGARMLRLHAEKPAVETVQANVKACDMFGGCAHRAYCPARASRLADFLPKEESKMGIKDKLKASLGLSDAPEKKADGTILPTTASEAQVAALGPAVAVQLEKVNEQFKDAMTPAVGVVPPDALPSPDDQPKPETPVEEPKAKRGRPKKTEQNQVVEGAAALQAELPKATNEPVKSLLLIDGAVLKGFGTPLEPMLRRAAETAAEKAGVADWRLVDFGKGAGLLLVSFAELWAKEPPRGLLTISSREPEAVAVLAWLIDRVDVAAKGV